MILTENRLFQKFVKFLRRKAGAFKDGSKSAWFNRFGTMDRHDSAPVQISGVSQDSVAAALAPYDETGFFQRPDDSGSRDLRQGRLVQTVTSISSIRTSDSGRGILSSIRDCIYSFIASFAFLMHSSNVSPWVAHPGNAGTKTEYPIVSGSNIILNRCNIFFTSKFYQLYRFVKFVPSRQHVNWCGEGLI